MPKTGFYNDNEYRAYPFINKQPSDTRQAQVGGNTVYDKIKRAIHSAIVDAGFILGVDADGAQQQAVHGLRVQLLSIAASATSNSFTAVFISTATNATITFAAEEIAGDWVVVRAVSGAPTDTVLNCGVETPYWRGYIVAAGSNILKDTFTALGFVPNEMGQLVFNAATETEPFEFEIEPGRLQNKARSYLRSVTVGNFDRIRVPICGEDTVVTPRPVRVALPCMRGPIVFEEGYNCQLSQINRSNTFTVSARKDAGAKKDAAYCANNGEIPLFLDEEKPILIPATGNAPEVRSEFYSGGPACNELVYTINGVGGRNVSFIPGAGITISTETNKIVVEAQDSLVTDCTPAANQAQPD